MHPLSYCFLEHAVGPALDEFAAIIIPEGLAALRRPCRQVATTTVQSDDTLTECIICISDTVSNAVRGASLPCQLCHMVCFVSAMFTNIYQMRLCEGSFTCLLEGRKGTSLAKCLQMLFACSEYHNPSFGVGSLWLQSLGGGLQAHPHWNLTRLCMCSWLEDRRWVICR